jgi:hypothetical protein
MPEQNQPAAQGKGHARGAYYFSVTLLACLLSVLFSGARATDSATSASAETSVDVVALKLQISDEVLINQSLSGNQDHATVAACTEGFMVAYNSSNIMNDTSGQAAAARIFRSHLIPVTDEFTLNTDVTIGNQRVPDVAADKNALAVAVWSCGSAHGYDVYAKVYSMTCAGPLTADLKVNIAPSAQCTWPDVTMSETGDFVVVWDEVAGDELNYYVRAYAKTGAPKTEPVRINAEASAVPYAPPSCPSHLPDIDAGRNGWVIAAWEHFSDDSSLIKSRVFNIDTLFFDEEEIVSAPPPGFHDRRPSVDLNDRGDVLITWTQADNSSKIGDIYVKKFDAASSTWSTTCPHADSPLLELNQHRSIGKLLDNGSFAVAWTGKTGIELYVDDVFVRFFNSAGAPLCEEKIVNQTREGYQARPALDWIIEDTLYHMIITWESRNEDGSDLDVYGRSYMIQMCLSS